MFEPPRQIFDLPPLRSRGILAVPLETILIKTDLKPPIFLVFFEKFSQLCFFRMSKALLICTLLPFYYIFCTII